MAPTVIGPMLRLDGSEIFQPKTFKIEFLFVFASAVIIILYATSINIKCYINFHNIFFTKFISIESVTTQGPVLLCFPVLPLPIAEAQKNEKKQTEQLSYLTFLFL